jgi:hypothetical protein
MLESRAEGWDWGGFTHQFGKDAGKKKKFTVHFLYLFWRSPFHAVKPFIVLHYREMRGLLDMLLDSPFFLKNVIIA